MTTKDITGKSHWDSVYAGSDQAVKGLWTPKAYEDKCLEQLLFKYIREKKPRTILEVGCGNSTWLPYLAKATGASVTGIDYSLRGCELARSNLSAAGVTGKVICGDFFALDPQEIGEFDFAYSLGLVEHFDDLLSVLRTLVRFVASGGVFLTEVPNLKSIHGILTHLYQPDLLAKHKIISEKDLYRAYESLDLKNIESGLVGTFSVGIVAWGMEQRFPKFDPVILPIMRLVSRIGQEILNRANVYVGIPYIAPFAYAVAKK